MVLSPGFRRAGARDYLELTASGASFDDGAWSTEVQGLVAVRSRAPGERGAEFLGGLGASAARRSGGTSQGWGRLRWHALNGATDLWAGVAVGAVHTTLDDRSLGTLEAGIGATAGRFQLFSNGGLTRLGDGTRWAEWSGMVRRPGRVTASLSAGFRQEWEPVLVDVGWVAGSVETPLPPLGSLVLAAGTYPADLAQGFASGSYVSLTFRLGGGRQGAVPPPRSTRAEGVGRTSGGARFEARPLGGGQVRLVVRAPRAATVEVAGDFTDWSAVPLTRRGDTWVVVLDIPAGVHQMALRLDGGTWRAPPGTTRTSDEFGGEAGLLVVE